MSKKAILLLFILFFIGQAIAVGDYTDTLPAFAEGNAFAIGSDTIRVQKINIQTSKVGTTCSMVSSGNSVNLTDNNVFIGTKRVGEKFQFQIRDTDGSIV